jgi:hypothetical protein
MHTIEASLRNADHSDAGVTDSITVDVIGSAGANAGAGATTSPNSSTSAGDGYGY